MEGKIMQNRCPNSKNEQGPLTGLRVLDLTRILAGPICTQLLGDLGADVIKVEHPISGDDTRKWGPPYVRGADGEETSESAYFLAANRNKRSVAVDLSKQHGASIIKKILRYCDILIENFKVGGLQKYGLSFSELKGEFPSLVYCSISGFGQTGPYASQAGYDYLAQGMGGIMAITGEPLGQPMKVGVAISDIMCGMYASTAILSAIRHRDLTDCGQHIDLSLLDTQIAWLANVGSNYLISGEEPCRWGNQHPNIVPYQVFEASDGFIILAVGNDKQFQKFCNFAELDNLSNDANFSTNASRVENRETLIPIIEEAIKKKSKDYWLMGLKKMGVPSGPINNISDALADPHVQHRNMTITMKHRFSGSGHINLVANPIKMSETPVQYKYSPPSLSEHTDQVLSELLGMKADERKHLRANGVIG